MNEPEVFILFVIGALAVVVWLLNSDEDNGTTIRRAPPQQAPTPKVASVNSSGSHSWTKNTQWRGKGIPVTFRYIDVKGENSLRSVTVTHHFKNSSGDNYIEGFCYSSQDNRIFKTSRIAGDIHVNGLSLTPTKFVKRLRSGETHFEPPQVSQAQSKPKTAKPRVRVAANVDRPSTDVAYKTLNTKEARRKQTAGLSNIEWRSKGILSLSGYRVGKTRGVVKSERQRILNNIMLKDDLSDVKDRAYAEEWGAPKSRSRYKKMHDSLTTFLYNAKAKSGQNMKAAISDWQADIKYLEKEFGKKYG